MAETVDVFDYEETICGSDGIAQTDIGQILRE